MRRRTVKNLAVFATATVVLAGSLILVKYAGNRKAFIKDTGVVSSGYDDRSTISKGNFNFLKTKVDKLDDYDMKVIENSENLGLIVIPTSTDEEYVIRTVEKIKRMVKEYNVNGPILYDINAFMNNFDLPKNCVAGELFCQLLTVNGCYAGFYGKADNLTKYESVFDRYVSAGYSFSEYDKMVSAKDSIIDPMFTGNYGYDGNYNMLEIQVNTDKPSTGLGTVYYRNDINQVIDENGLNQVDNYISQEAYEVKFGDTLESIAEKYNLSLRELAKYNNLSVDYDLVVGEYVNIPIVIHYSTPYYADGNLLLETETSSYTYTLK